jgi:peptide deformylase
MILKIVQVGDPVLRNGTRMLSREEVHSPQFQQLVEWMRETMRDAPGVGLAAPQVGLPLRFAVIEDGVEAEATEREPTPFHVIVNPVLTAVGATQIEHFEGCLSLEGFQARVQRAHAVRVEGWDHHANPVTIEASGWYARILQHEVDHLDGKLYIDRMNPRTFTTARNAGLAAKVDEPA